ncbi:MAG: hypothetical protein N3A69_03330 [Leptospiraceae bacterium]|nr:hypothetical protein [Leptospiraceae bacterium]
MKYFFDTLYLVYFSPVEFPYYWGQYYSKWNEFFVVLFSAFSIALGFSVNSLEFSELGIFLYLFFMNLIFLFAFAKFFSWILNQRAQEYGGEFSQKILFSYLNYSFVIFWFMPGIVATTAYFNVNTGASLTLILFVLSLLYILNIVRAVKIFYRLEQELAFRIIFSSSYSLIIFPLFFAIYYFIILIFLMMSP